jgi:trk system potassium uptake protein TrkH
MRVVGGVSTSATVISTLGSLMLIQGFLLLLPLLVTAAFGEWPVAPAFLFPAAACLLLGLAVTRFVRHGEVRFLQSMLVCGTAWLVLSVFGALPFVLTADAGFVDAYFETVSGFTTTGITIFTNIEGLSKTIQFWRSLIQWAGGLGILTLFLAVTFRSNGAYFQLFAAESHKIDAARPTPSILRTVIILWCIYAGFTIAEAVILKALGLSVFDAICHSLTTLSTGGFSPYDASIDHFRQAGYVHYRAIEYVITFFMLMGGVNFLLHFYVLTGRLRDVLSNLEYRWFLGIVAAAVILILINRRMSAAPVYGQAGGESVFRHTIFTVVSIITTTGYGTVDINEAFFPAGAKQLLLVLMFIGGSVGSTAGGVKVLRIAILFRLFGKQITKLRLPRLALSEVVVDGRIFPDAEIKRIAGLVIGWLFLILAGGLVTSFFAELDGYQSFSGMFSAVGNIGPCYFSVREMSELPVVVKLTYVFGMLAGRLEILPVLLIFSPRAWRS